MSNRACDARRRPVGQVLSFLYIFSFPRLFSAELNCSFASSILLYLPYSLTFSWSWDLLDLSSTITSLYTPLPSGMSDALLKRGIYVVGFSFPVVPRGQARIRVQLSAAHSVEQVRTAL